MSGYAYDDWDIPIATQLMLEALRTAIGDIDDDQELPLGQMLADLGERLDVDTSDVNTEETCTASELRRRVRKAIEALAHGETPSG